MRGKAVVIAVGSLGRTVSRSSLHSPLFFSASAAIVLRLLNCARRMVRSVNCMDVLKRAKSAAVN
jgi:hypothetical protein